MSKKPYKPPMRIGDIDRNQYSPRASKDKKIEEVTIEEVAEDLTATAFNVPKKDLFPEIPKIGKKMAKNEGERKNEKQNEMGKETESFSERQEIRKEQLELAKKAGNKKMIEYWEGRIQQTEESAKQRAQQKVKDTKKPQEISNNNLINKNMSKEKPTAEQEQQQVLAPETSTAEVPKKTPKAESRQGEAIFSVYLPNKSRFEKLSDWGQEKVVSLYEKTGTAYEKSFMGTVTTEKGGGILNRLEAAFNNKLMKWHEDKAMAIGQKFDNAKNRQHGFEMSRQQMENSLAKLKEHQAKGFSTVAAEAGIKKEIRNMEERMAKAQIEVNKYQSKLDARNNKTREYANARDMACENLKNRYEEKLAPRERQIENLKQYNESLDTEIERAEFQRDRIKKEIADFQSECAPFMRGGSLWDRLRGRDPISAATAGLRMQLDDYNSRIDTVLKEKSVTDSRLARAEDRANVYRNKADAISAKTHSRPILVGESGKQRARVETHEKREEIKTADKEGAETEEESAIEEFTLKQGINKWNKYLKQKNPNMPARDLVDAKTFKNVTGVNLSSTESFESFKNALDMYYKDKGVKMPRKDFEKNIKSFEKDFEEIK